MLQLPACHGEDADHQVDAPVAQQRHLRFVALALLGFLLGLDGGPDADAEHQQVEEDHDGHAGDVESHDGADVDEERCAERLPGCLEDAAYGSPLHRTDAHAGKRSSGGGGNCRLVCGCVRARARARVHVYVRHNLQSTMFLLAYP